MGSETRRYFAHPLDSAQVIAVEVLGHGFTAGWSGSIEQRDAVAAILRPFNIIYVDDMKGEWAKAKFSDGPTDGDPAKILDRVKQAMAPAENNDGPEGQQYLDLMNSIATEALRRLHNYARHLAGAR